MSDSEFDLIQDFLPDWIKAHQFAWVSVTMLPRFLARRASPSHLYRYGC